MLGIIKKIFFWQPKKDYYQFFSQFHHGRNFLVATNYFIWLFLFYVSYLLIRHQTNIFWQLFLSTVLSEIIEKLVKVKNLWKRPAFKNGNSVPKGLIKSWYLKGSFPSGHTIKAVFFLLFLVNNPVLSPLVYLAVVIPLLLIRVVCGFHYPVDVLGGGIIGLIIYFLTFQLQAPDWANQFIATIFNFVFFIK